MKQKKSPKKPAGRKSSLKPTRRAKLKPPSITEPVITKPTTSDDIIASNETNQINQTNHINQNNLSPYNENLLDYARTQWRDGNWEGLARMERGGLQDHPDRAKLALLAAAGHMQQGNTGGARQFTRLALEWGCGKKLVSQVLIAGVHNTLGRAAAAAGQKPRALKHFEASVTVGAPGSPSTLQTQARIARELEQMGLPGAAGLQLAAGNALKTHEGDKVSDRNNVPLSPSSTPIFEKAIENVAKKLREEIKVYSLNPYVHNRTMTSELNAILREFAKTSLNRDGLKSTYIDYLASKAIQIERNCVGRLATTVQDAVARQLVAECVPGERLCILEIGALYGVSLAILYNHAITRYQQVQVACLDPFEGYYGKAVDAVLNSPVNDLTFIRNMRLANVPQEDYRIIKYYSTDTAALSAAGSLDINLLIIDGDHSYEGVKFDFENYLPLLAPGGYIIFDDYNAKEWPGVQQFIDNELAAVSGIEYLGAVSRTAVARKKP